MTNPSELKPCPFCGGEDLKEQSGPYNIPKVICKGCFASTFMEGKSAVEAWNTRTDLYTEALERVAELERAGDKMHKEIIAMAIGPVGVVASAKKAADAWKALKGDTE